ncbi:uncharacterized protein MONBRDRAFT_25564 [Monosiga brevicollis MX1]|uniref:Protein kinase domain-containing protein n=1 Tax=Monosiga brevicollis TaxID=81824 RepID=A9UZS6_MONBE|nr:uncharacterized protein MONBRDRAFT_25564 [Monosiga brevicollis MX1]EDQ89418.1 predicted protein [Monosiga brevicollis MX1]|eukprot:XP_001745994.1 hypothetical protein [Monosiga brevicollis MX1]
MAGSEVVEPSGGWLCGGGQKRWQRRRNKAASNLSRQPSRYSRERILVMTTRAPEEAADLPIPSSPMVNPSPSPGASTPTTRAPSRAPARSSTSMASYPRHPAHSPADSYIDYAVSEAEMQALRTWSAIIIQKTWRGYATRARLTSNGGCIPYVAPNNGYRMRRKSVVRRDRLPDARFAEGRISDSSEVFALYQVNWGHQLGSGAFASVYPCHDVHRNCQIAAKVVDKAKVIFPPERDLMFQEIRILRTLDHPHCVKLFDVMEVSDAILLFMELLDGGDLFDRIENSGAFGESHARDIIAQCLAAVEYLHNKRIVHRDIKPENIMFASVPGHEPVVKLTDFGLSCTVDLPLRSLVGSPSYMAPEIAIQSSRGYSLPIDMWALGVVTHVALAGCTPYAAPNLDYSEVWRNVSTAGQDFIRMLLNPNPTLRLRARQASRHPWLFSPDAALAQDMRSLTMTRLSLTRQVSRSAAPKLPIPTPSPVERDALRATLTNRSLLSQLAISSGLDVFGDTSPAVRSDGSHSGHHSSPPLAGSPSSNESPYSVSPFQVERGWSEAPNLHVLTEDE